MSLEELEIARRETIERCTYPLQIATPVDFLGFELSERTNVLVDGEFRDRALWCADLYSSGPATLKFSDEGSEIWRDSLLAIAHKQYPSGKIPSCVSLKLEYRFLSPFIDSYQMWWAVGAWEYLQKTKDKNFENAFIIVFKKLFDYLKNRVGDDLLFRSEFPNSDWNWTIFRSERSALANSLFYKVVEIAKDVGIKSDLNANNLKNKFNNYFWDEEKKAYKDSKHSKAIFLETNALAVIFNLCPDERKQKVLQTLSKMETNYGPVTYIGKPFAVSSWHKNLICPFTSYLYSLALEQLGQKKKAEEIYINTINAGLALSGRFNAKTIPEFWKAGDTLVGNPAIPFIHNQVTAESICHSWGAYGDYDPHKNYEI